MGQSECDQSRDSDSGRDSTDSGNAVSGKDLYCTVNYLFASYLQTADGGHHKIKKVEKIRAGKAKFFFDITEPQADELKLKFHNSACSEFERFRKYTIDLSY
jgi:hypothetical protein